MVKKHKKGFTIVELVVVIAVIAILAAVLIPTFVNLVHKAEFSNDQALVRNINTTLAISAEGKDGKPTMYDTLVDVQENGFVVENLTPRSSGSDIVWDEEHNQFVLVYENGTKYFTGTQWNKDLNTKKMWKIYTTMPASSDYSVYLAGTTYNQAVTVNGVGFDAGRNTKIPSVSYTNAGAAQNVTIRTQGGDLIITAKNDTVNHYGEADSVSVVDIDTESYHENGTVKFLEVTAGHIVLEKDAVVSAFHFTATGTGDDAKFQNADGKKISIDISKVSEEKLPEFSRDPVTIAENGTYVAEVKSDTTEYIWLFGKGIKEQMVVTNTTAAIAENGVLKDGVVVGAEDGSVAEQIANPANRNSNGQLVASDGVTPVTPENAVVEEVASKEDVQIGVTLFAGGSGSKNDPFLIVDYDTFQHVSLYDWYGIALDYYYAGHTWADAQAYANQNALSTYHGNIGYFKVKPGIAEIDCANWKPVYLYGCIDGSNVTLKNLDKNLFQEAYAYDSHTSSYIECLVENFNVEANISYSGSASAIAQSAGPVIKFKNVNISGKIEGNYVGSYFTFGAGQFESDSSYNPTVAGQYTFENCVSSATLQCNSIGEGGAGGFIHHPYGATGTTITIKDSKYTGTMYVFSGKKHGYVSCFDATTVIFEYSEEFEQGTYTTTDVNKVNSSNYVYPAPNYVSVSGSKHGQLSNYDVIEINAVSNASYATATLFIAPNPGALLYPALQETLTLENGKFTTINVRKYDITWNGEVKDVITGNNYEVGGNGGFTGINGSYIIINQYSSDGTLLSSDQYTVSGKLGN